jgi:hypothetical protein
MLVHGMKAIVLSWWAVETCMSPNQKEVGRKILGLHLYEKKPTQYLMETQVIVLFIFVLLHLSLYCMLFHWTFFSPFQVIWAYFPLHNVITSL